MYRQFNIQQFYVLPTHCIYVFCVDLRTNSDHFTTHPSHLSAILNSELSAAHFFLSLYGGRHRTVCAEQLLAVRSGSRIRSYLQYRQHYTGAAVSLNRRRAYRAYRSTQTVRTGLIAQQDI